MKNKNHVKKKRLSLLRVKDKNLQRKENHHQKKVKRVISQQEEEEAEVLIRR